MWALTALLLLAASSSGWMNRAAMAARAGVKNVLGGPLKACCFEPMTGA